MAVTGASSSVDNTIHPGSWFNLPDFGFTEKLANTLGGGRTAQGGSNLTGGGAPTAQITSNNGSSFQSLQGPGLGWNNDYRVGGDILGTSTSNPTQLTKQPIQTNNNSNGNKSITEGEALANHWDWNKLPDGYTQAQPSQDDMSRQVDSAYGEANGIYDQMYNDWQGNKQNFLDQYTKPYDAQRPLIDQAYQTGVNQIQGQRDQTYQGEASALDAAKRLYNELTQGVRQRFGGSNSAGDFANMFYGREFQRNTGQIQNTTGQNIKSLMDKQNEIKGQYDAQVQNLNLQKEQALAQAQTLFQSKLDEINNTKGQLAQAKAGLKLQALQELRQRANQIQDSYTQFAQNLALQHNQATEQIRSATQAYGTQAATPVNTQAFANPQYSGMGSNQANTNSLSNVSGNLGYNTQKKDQYGLPSLSYA